MRPGKPGSFCGYAKSLKQGRPILFVKTAIMNQFIGVSHLPDVVNGSPEKHSITIHGEIWPAGVQGFQNL